MEGEERRAGTVAVCIYFPVGFDRTTVLDPPGELVQCQVVQMPCRALPQYPSVSDVV